MRGLGCMMVILAIGSLIIPFFGFQFMLLSWVDNWGLPAGIGIRIGIVILGGILAVIGGGGDSD